MDNTSRFVKCFFRDEDLEQDSKNPNFHQIDCEMAFVDKRYSKCLWRIDQGIYWRIKWYPLTNFLMTSDEVGKNMATVINRISALDGVRQNSMPLPNIDFAIFNESWIGGRAIAIPGGAADTRKEMTD